MKIICPDSNSSNSLEVKAGVVLDKYNNPKVVASIFDMANERNRVEVDSIYSDAKASLFRSDLVSQYNFLGFFDGSREFFIIQKVKWAQAIFEPFSKSLYTKSNDSSLVAAVKAFVHGRKKINFSYDRRPSFGGLLCYSMRPYHYFYNILPGVELLNDQCRNFRKFPRVISISGGDFSSISRVYGLDEKKELVFNNDKELNEFLDHNNFFIISSATSKPFNFIGALDERLVLDSSKVICENEKVKKFIKKSKNSTCILFCLMGERRSWVNQLDVIINIINRCVSEGKGDFLFLFDGVTSTETKSADEMVLEKYQEMVSYIVRKTGIPEHQCGSLLGMLPREKIALTQCADFFISDMATSSMYASRICRKPGVVHYNPSMSYQGHVHSKVVKFPGVPVCHEASKANNPLTEAYAVDGEGFLEEFFKYFEWT